MLKHLKILFAAIFISLIGSLPLGTLNLASFQLTLSSGVHVALAFGLGAVMVEVIFVHLTLQRVFHLSDKWTMYCLPLLATVLIFMGCYSFMKEIKIAEGENSLNIQSSFISGVTLSALNPLQFPYWLSWSNIFRSKKLLDDKRLSKYFYLLGIAIGSGMSFISFILVATNYQNKLFTYAYLIHNIAGGLYFLFATIILTRLFKLIYKTKFARI